MQKLLFQDFESEALSLFRHQAKNNTVYSRFQSYCKDLDAVPEISDIPFMPISFFKDFEIKTNSFDAEQVF